MSAAEHRARRSRWVEDRPGQPLLWRLDLEALRQLGWTIGRDSLAPPPSDEVDRDFANHPFALDPAWNRVHTWRATFDTVEGPTDATVVHEHRIEARDGWPQHPTTPLNPWRWRVDGPSIGVRHGTADSPILGAAAVEAMLADAGVDVGEPTMTRRSGSTGEPMP